ncbi:hypothetical protein D3C80_2083330 [compost metagenome]
MKLEDKAGGMALLLTLRMMIEAECGGSEERRSSLQRWLRPCPDYPLKPLWGAILDVATRLPR